MSVNSKDSVNWKVGLVLTLIGFALVTIGSSMLHVGAVNEDVVTIIRGSLIFIAGVSAVVMFGIVIRWEFRS
jgi:ABC-type uncharacterized transport system permease subunit